MLTEEDDVEIHALARRGWSVSAIARHTGRDRKTIAKYLAGPGPVAGARRRAVLSRFGSIWRRGLLMTRMCDGDGALSGGGGARVRSLVSDVRARDPRAAGCGRACEACRAGGRGVTVGLEHEPGEEMQWDWLELTETPWGEPAYVLVGALSFSGKCRACSAEGMTSRTWSRRSTACCAGWAAPARAWRTDRMATVVYPGSDRMRPEARSVAKHYGVEVCGLPARTGRSARVSSRRRSTT